MVLWSGATAGYQWLKSIMEILSHVGPVAASGAAKKHGEGGVGFVIRAPEFKNDSFDCR